MADKANPAALGLVGFGLTTILLSAVNAGLLPAHGEAVVLPLALAFGGTAQVIAGIMEFQTGNTFGTTAFISYGAFWWWFASLVFLGGNKLLDLSGADSAIGFTLVLWGVFTFGLWISDLSSDPSSVLYLPDLVDRFLPVGLWRHAWQSDAASAGRLGWPSVRRHGHVWQLCYRDQYDGRPRNYPRRLQKIIGSNRKLS